MTSLLFNYPFCTFYFMLYYTDTLSTLSLMATAYLAPTTSSGQFAKLTSLLAATLTILVRQTNAVWVLFIAGTTMLESITASGFISNDDFTIGLVLRFVYCLWLKKLQIVNLTWSLLIPVIGFLIFVIVNGGVVVGDKENHQPVQHFAMAAHAIVIYGMISTPYVIAEGISHHFNAKKKSTISVVGRMFSCGGRGNMILALILSLFLSLGFLFYSLSHPFLLSDNRHYTFYLWQRYLRHFQVRLLLCPMYFIVLLVGLTRLLRQQGSLWLLIYLAAVVISLTPTPLLEPRYFTPAVLIAVLHSPKITDSVSNRIITMMWTLFFIICNLLTMYVFLYRLFRWPDGSLARFMY